VTFVKKTQVGLFVSIFSFLNKKEKDFHFNPSRKFVAKLQLIMNPSSICST
jgi:hypothetical protein